MLLNDSKKDFASRLDQHENIGRGKIGTVALQRIIRSPKLKNAVFILETPKIEQKDDLKNLKLAKKMIQK